MSLLGLDVYPGGITAFELRGYGHYIALGGRKKSNLSRTLKTMSRYGLVELRASQRGRLIPRVKYDTRPSSRASRDKIDRRHDDLAAFDGDVAGAGAGDGEPRPRQGDAAPQDLRLGLDRRHAVRDAIVLRRPGAERRSVQLVARAHGMDPVLHVRGDCLDSHGPGQDPRGIHDRDNDRCDRRRGIRADAGTVHRSCAGVLMAIANEPENVSAETFDDCRGGNSNL